LRIAVGLLASATLLFLAGAVGVVGTWALVIGVVIAVASAVTTVVVMEEREHLIELEHVRVPARTYR